MCGVGCPRSCLTVRSAALCGFGPPPQFNLQSHPLHLTSNLVVGTQTRLLGRHKRARATANGSAGCRRPCPPTSATPRRSGLREGAARRAARRCQRCLSCVIRRRWDPASRRLGFARAARAPRRFSFLAASRRRWQLRGAAFSPAACLLRARAPAVRRALRLLAPRARAFAGGRRAAPPSRAGSDFPPPLLLARAPPSALAALSSLCRFLPRFILPGAGFLHGRLQRVHLVGFASSKSICSLPSGGGFAGFVLRGGRRAFLVPDAPARAGAERSRGPRRVRAQRSCRAHAACRERRARSVSTRRSGRVYGCDCEASKVCDDSTLEPSERLRLRCERGL